MSSEEINQEDLVSDGLKDFVKKLQAIMPDGYTITLREGPKWIKIVHDYKEVGYRVWGFVHPITGELFKPASWACPAKHSRGNVLDPDLINQVDWTGPRYLR